MSTTEKQKFVSILEKLCSLRDSGKLPPGFNTNLADAYAKARNVRALPNNIGRWLRNAKARSDAGNTLTEKDVFLIQAANELLQNAAEEAKKNAEQWEK